MIAGIKKLVSPNKFGQLIAIACYVTSEQLQQQCTTGSPTIVKPYSSALYRCTIVSTVLELVVLWLLSDSICDKCSIHSTIHGLGELTIVSFDIVFANFNRTEKKFRTIHKLIQSSKGLNIYRNTYNALTT